MLEHHRAYFWSVWDTIVQCTKSYVGLGNVWERQDSFKIPLLSIYFGSDFDRHENDHEVWNAWVIPEKSPDVFSHCNPPHWFPNMDRKTRRMHQNLMALDDTWVSIRDNFYQKQKHITVWIAVFRMPQPSLFFFADPNESIAVSRTDSDTREGRSWSRRLILFHFLR